MKRDIIINVESLQTRVAILEDGRVEEFRVEPSTEERVVGSIYKGSIQNLEHDLQAAFVDIGMKKNAFLHYWDMMPEGVPSAEEETGEKRRRRSRKKRYTNEEITKQFPPGSEIVVQVTKGPIGTKGPRVTAALSIPGRYMVMMPGSSSFGVSRKIEDQNERQRIKKILSRLPLPRDTGIIARTAASGSKKRSFARDLRALAVAWEDLQAAIRDKPAPCCVYQEPDLVERVVRDWLTEDVDNIILDSREHYERVRKVAARISRSARSKVQYYEGDLPIFTHYGVEKQLAETFRRKVNLKCGGCIVVDETEALVAIDVNTGRHKGKGSQEEAILEVNTEAVQEVARQIRLRNIGGLVVLDLIDMKYKKHQNAVYKALKAELRRDRAKTNVLPISPLGLLEMTRQRVEESIHSAAYEDCPYCHGHGTVKSALRMSVEIQRQISAIARKRRQQGESALNLQIIVHPTVLDRLRKEDEEVLIELEREYDGHLSFRSDSSKHVEFFCINDAETGKPIYASSVE